MWLWKVAVAMAMFQPPKKINHWEKKGLWSNIAMFSQVLLIIGRSVLGLLWCLSGCTAASVENHGRTYTSMFMYIRVCLKMGRTPQITSFIRNILTIQSCPYLFPIHSNLSKKTLCWSRLGDNRSVLDVFVVGVHVRGYGCIPIVG